MSKVKEISNHASKPYRTGAWVLISKTNSDEILGEWIYTANPHLYRQHPNDNQNFPFYQTPEHMLIED